MLLHVQARGRHGADAVFVSLHRAVIMLPFGQRKWQWHTWKSPVRHSTNMSAFFCFSRATVSAKCALPWSGWHVKLTINTVHGNLADSWGSRDWQNSPSVCRLYYHMHLPDRRDPHSSAQHSRDPTLPPPLLCFRVPKGPMEAAPCWFSQHRNDTLYGKCVRSARVQIDVKGSARYIVWAL